MSDAAQDNSPVLEGWFTLDAEQPHLIGTRCQACGTYYFPKQSTYCRNPECDGEDFAEVELSRSGRLWSYTNAVYQPPPPFVAGDPFEPYAIAAVELDAEKMIVLGPVVDGVDTESLDIGMPMTLALEPLADGRMTWKWRPETEGGAA